MPDEPGALSAASKPGVRVARFASSDMEDMVAGVQGVLVVPPPGGLDSLPPRDPNAGPPPMPEPVARPMPVPLPAP